MGRGLTANLVFSAVLAVLTAPFLIPLAVTLKGRGNAVGLLVDMFGGGLAALTESWLSFYQATALAQAPLLLMVFLAWLAFFAIYGAIERAKSPQRELKDGAFGAQTSENSSFAVIRRCHTWKGGEAESPGFVVGYVRGRYIVTPAIHAVFVAPSGSYKTRASVLPSLACIASADGGNIVATDPSLEIYCYSRAMLERAGFKVVLVDFENPYRGERVNFLAPLVKLHRLGLDHLAEERASEIGALLFPETGRDSDAFSQPAAGLVSAVSYVVATSDGVPSGQRHLYTVIRIILEGTTGDDSSKLKSWLRSFGADSPAVGMAATFLASTGRYEASILGTLHTGLKPFNTTAMRYLVSGDGFDPDEFLSTRSALVLHTLTPGMPGNKAASLLLAQLWAATVRNGQRRGSNRPTYYLLDEAHSVPPFGLPTILEQSRKYDAHFALYLQSLSGLDAHKTPKEDGKDAILANCDCKCLFRAGSVQDADYFEKISGMATYLAKNTGESRNSRDASSSTGYTERERPVWMAGDIMQRDPLVDGVLLFQNPTNHPKMMGKFEVPIREITKVPFAVDLFGTLGSKEFESRLISDEVNGLDEKAALRHSREKPEAWAPDFGTVCPKPASAIGQASDDEELFGL